MNRFVTMAAAAALLGASSLAALAAEATGKIATVDAAAQTVTLEDGQTFALAAGVDAAALEVGADVKVTFEEAADGTKTATAISAGM